MSKASDIMRKLMDVVDEEEGGIPLINDVTVTYDKVTFQRLDEGKFVNGRFDRNIRIDQPTHMAGNGQVHAHILGRKGGQVVVVNVDGTGSHGSKGILHKKDADALRAHGFSIAADRIIEYIILSDVGPELLLG